MRRQLTPEKSKNLSAGITMQPVPALSITADYYKIDIADRVVLSENLTQTAVRDFLAANGEPGVAGGRFFTNAIDTRTTGVDVVVNYGLNFGRRGILRLTAGASTEREQDHGSRSRSRHPHLPRSMMRSSHASNVAGSRKGSRVTTSSSAPRTR